MAGTPKRKPRKTFGQALNTPSLQKKLKNRKRRLGIKKYNKRTEARTARRVIQHDI